MPPSEFLRVEHNINGKLISDPVEFANLQYTADGHTSTSKDAKQDDSRSPRKRKSCRRHKHSKTNKAQQSCAKQQPPKQSQADSKALQDAIDRDHRRMGFEPMKRNHDPN